MINATRLDSDPKLKTQDSIPTRIMWFPFPWFRSRNYLMGTPLREFIESAAVLQKRNGGGVLLVGLTLNDAYASRYEIDVVQVGEQNGYRYFGGSEDFVREECCLNGYVHRWVGEDFPKRRNSIHTQVVKASILHIFVMKVQILYFRRWRESNTCAYDPNRT